ncbi:MAG: UDP-3-O-(3-hydroxymyristoyl)glucosamine N-acyltransferase [Chitinophagaceae bacterium]|nr:MAG: UDP-3-O-(3-hydroxymyristoyl) glucosamine N-acyltransferase [Bacteroidetes bacterium OLB11]MCC6448100.1 UDP-3-O-(3-hydroxymyristoyl)glucosamine N-acyltransferase [Chitinophagaceae bacterium]HMN32659.1 UDP-3-O-(3-hydroxymyristoyl)glucosamine N-acyltransferase [Chitinophagaceae bacterium]
MKFTAQQIATLVQGKVEGDIHSSVHSISKIEEAKQGDLCFLANPKYEDYIYESQASIILVNNQFSPKREIHATLIRVPDAYAAFASLLNVYQGIIEGKPRIGIEENCFISKSAQIGKDAYVAAFSYISDKASIGEHTKIYPHTFIGEGVKIGNNCTINSGVHIYKNCVLGNNIILHAGTVIGSDGFGFAPQNDHYQKIPQLGNVVIEDNVEIGANCTIDRATIGSTIIRKGAKLDNLIQIAHNVEVGENTVISAQAGVSGSTKIGSNVMIGGQAGIVGHIKIADGSKINAQSGVSKTIKNKNTSLTDSPAFEYKGALKSQAIYKNLPSLLERIKNLEEILIKNNSNSK